jgi:hypothetical protein
VNVWCLARSRAPLQGDLHYLAAFTDFMSAAVRFDTEAIRLRGPDAMLNFPSGYGRNPDLIRMQCLPHVLAVGGGSRQEQRGMSAAIPYGSGASNVREPDALLRFPPGCKRKRTRTFRSVQSPCPVVTAGGGCGQEQPAMHACVPAGTAEGTLPPAPGTQRMEERDPGVSLARSSVLGHNSDCYRSAVFRTSQYQTSILNSDVCACDADPKFQLDDKYTGLHLLPA